MSRSIRSRSIVVEKSAFLEGSRMRPQLAVMALGDAVLNE